MEQDTLSIFQKIAPDVMGTIKERYLLLRHIADAEPVGRRTLAGLSGLSERVVRSHVDVLRRSGIVRFTTLGIAMEPEGKRLMPDLLECFLRLNNLDDIQRQIRQKLGLKNVYIVPGDSDSDKTVKEELGRRGALLLNDLFGSVDTVAISGGSTMAEVARMLPECLANVTILPARGSMGNHVEVQANYIAANVAAKTHSSYRMIHIPEGLSDSALQMMLKADRQTPGKRRHDGSGASRYLWHWPSRPHGPKTGDDDASARCPAQPRRLRRIFGLLLRPRRQNLIRNE